MVQGNSPLNQELDDGVEKYLSLTTSKPLRKVDYIVWPEGSIKPAILNDAKLRNEITEILKDEQILVTGSLRIEMDEGEYKFFNSMIFINNKNKTFYYDKNHLVPFGEFVPFKSIIPIRAVSSIQDLSRGSGIQTLKLSSNAPPFAPLICYEIAFTGDAVSHLHISPEWILNITNDAWYSYSSGAFQHLEIARIRAIEEGIPVVRSTNSGFSAVINQNGKILLKTKLFTEEVVDFNLPKKQGSRTIFSYFGNFPIIFCLFAFIIYAILDFIYIKNDKVINRAVYSRNKKYK